VLIAANNTLVRVQFPNGFENWADPFRATFRRKLNEKKYNRPYLREQRDLTF
jgi:hypothetical protein